MSKSSEHWFFIINPKAGGVKAEKDWPKIQAILDRSEVQYEFARTEHPDHGQILAKDAIRKGFRYLIAVGGDGTVNEVINGIFGQEEVNSSAIYFGVIPIGTGNDWSRMYKIPRSYKKAIHVLQKGKTSLQDIGKVVYTNKGQKKSRYFNNVLGVCFDAYVVEQTGTTPKHGIRGQIFYLLGILRFLNRYSCPSIQMKGEDFEWAGPAILANVGICRYSGGGMQLVPKAIPGDGLFDITVVEAMRPKQVYRRLLLLYNGKLYRDPQAHHFRSRWLEMSASPDSRLEVDGELLGYLPIRVEILPQCLNIISS